MPEKLPDLPEGYGWSRGPDGELGLVKVVHEIDKDSPTRERDIQMATLQVWRQEKPLVGMLMETGNPTRIPVSEFSAMALFEDMEPELYAEAYSDLTQQDKPGTLDPTDAQIEILRKTLPTIVEIVIDDGKTYTSVHGKRKRVIILSTGFCGVCGEPQFNSPGGEVCKNGHGGAPTVSRPEDAIEWK